jgi:N-acetylornithine carbamoyltransferase
MTMREKLGSPQGKRLVVMWAWHPKALPTAVPASAALAGAQLGMEVVIARPNGYDLDPDDYTAISSLAAYQGGSLRVTDDLDAAVDGADVVYPKSWGSLLHFGRRDDEAKLREHLRNWRLTQQMMERTAKGQGIAMHCLPVRRNVEVDGAVLDGPNSAVVDQAENRLHAQRALLLTMMK